MTVHISENADDVGRAVGALVDTLSSNAIQTNGRFTIAISGGSLPKVRPNCCSLKHLVNVMTDFTKRIGSDGVGKYRLYKMARIFRR